MEKMDIMLLEKIKGDILTGNLKGIRNHVRQAIEQDFDYETLIHYGLIGGLEQVTDLYKQNKLFIPDLLVAVKAMDVGMSEIERAYKSVKPVVLEKSPGIVLIGTVEGDVHDIGKNLVTMMLRNHGYEVHDLGVDVEAKQFVDEAERINADVIIMSAALTTTMQGMKAVIDRLVRRKIRDKYIVMVGGAPVSEKFAKRIGADYYTKNAIEALELIAETMENKYGKE